MPNFYRGHAPHERPIISLNCSFLVRSETVAGWVEQPWIVVGALHAGEQTKGFAGKLPGGQGAGVRKGTVGLTLLVAGLLPVLEVSERREFRRCLHPFDHLQVERVRVWSDKSLTEFFTRKVIRFDGVLYLEYLFGGICKICEYFLEVCIYNVCIYLTIFGRSKYIFFKFVTI